MRLQDDILGVYNSLVEFSKDTLGSTPVPLRVTFDGGMGCLSFGIPGKRVHLRNLNYYVGNLGKIKDTYLWPEDFDFLLKNLQILIKSGVLLEDRVCISPKDYGFDVWNADTRNLVSGPKFLCSLRFVSGNSWWFKFSTKLKFGI